MVYEIQSGPAPAGIARAERRGRKSPYPIKDLEVGQWFAAPLDQEWPLRRAVRYAHRKLGRRFQLQLDQTQRYWCVIRTK